VKKLFVVILSALALTTAVAHAQLRKPKADLTPMVERTAAHAGSKVRLALQVSLPEGLHSQSNKPRDPLLIPTVLTIDPPAGVTIDEVVYPKTTELKQEGQAQPLDVFERSFVIGVQATLAPSLAVGDVLVPLRIRYQACDNSMCFAPATADAAWTIQVVPAATKIAAGSPDPVFKAIAFGKGDKPVIAKITPAANSTAKPAAEAGAPAMTAAPASSATLASSPASSTLPATPGAASADAKTQLDGFATLATTGGYLGAADFVKFIRNAEAGIKEQGLFEGRGPIAIVLLVLLGGLALNLTPCVLPMIPINLAIIGAGAQAGSRSRGFMLGTAYGGAMALVYGIIGLVVVLTAGSFGSINASPWFNLGIAVLFVVLGLAMFDVLIIDFSRYSNNLGTGGGKGTMALAFTMGAVSALLAGACVAPVVIQVVLFSSNLYATGTKIALALPFCLGLGMALPWPIVGAGLAALPKPGMWMVRVKQAFGVFIIATALYYGYEAYGIFSNRWVDAGAVKAGVEEQLKAGWNPSLADGLSQATREGKPVLIDMWATWCKNCLTMDKTTLADESVKGALTGYVKIKLQIEDPDEPASKAIMQRFSAVGLPTYVILRPKKPGA
jgi:cytochrome c biogenesis protein CcdA/thiol-disulfide isomerase/thioredoxin